MKNINVEYDMDENDLDIILRGIAQDNNKKPSLHYIFENYKQLLSVFKPHTIKKVLDNIPEAYEHAPSEGEEIETSNVKIEKHGNKFKILNKKTNMYVGGEFNNLENAKKIAQYIENRFDKNDVQFEDEPHDIESDPESTKEESNFSNVYDKIMCQLNEAHVPEGDDEGRMLEYQLRTIRDEIDELLPMIKPNDQFESWVQSKVTLAKDYVSSVRDYLKQHYAEYHDDNDGDRGSHDMSDDAEALASAGHGTDEDYGYYGDREDNEEVKEGVVEEKKSARCTKVTGQMQSTRSDKKYMRCARVGGKLKRIHYGDPKRRIKKSNPKRRKSFRARHKCSTAKPGTAKYFSCKNW
jgi:hypothetical protein